MSPHACLKATDDWGRVDWVDNPGKEPAELILIQGQHAMWLQMMIEKKSEMEDEINGWEFRQMGK